MTAIGKILVFLNLVFALVTGGLIGMVFLTRTNWYAAYQKADEAAKAQATSYQQLLQSEMELVRAKEQQAKDAQQAKAQVDGQLQAKQTELDQVKAQLAANLRTNDSATTNVQTVTSELERRRNEVRQLTESNSEFANRIRDLEKQLTKTRDEAVTNKLNNDALRERMQSVLAQNEDLQRRLGILERGGVAVSQRGGNVPPPENVRGTVKAVDGNLVTVSVGTDAGVNKDNILYAFRLSPKEEYLGELTIISATPFEAVGRFRPSKRSAALKPGDEVASRILGSK